MVPGSFLPSFGRVDRLLIAPRVESNLLSRWVWRWRRWIQDVHDALQDFDDASLVSVEPCRELGFQRLQLTGKITRAAQ